MAHERLFELNRQAADFYAAQVDASWVPGYLTTRFGNELAERLLVESRFTIGYAPAGWTNLTSHLQNRGASDDEVVASGLGVYASTGRVIDRFRDRLVTPVIGRSQQGELEIRGWLGRRNPHPTAMTVAGPRYLNTPETVLFEKRHELYGLSENRDLLDCGAAPVLVEGPLDALAVTLVGGGHYVGVSVMGASLTDAQADLLRPYCEQGCEPIIVATDADPAGQRAARDAFWQLARRGSDPQHLKLAGCKDPAELVERDGGLELAAALKNTRALAETVISHSVAPWDAQLRTVEGAVLSARAAISVIVATPPESWPERICQVVKTTGVARQTATEELIRAMSLWSADPEAAAERCPHDPPPCADGNPSGGRGTRQASTGRSLRTVDNVRGEIVVPRRDPRPSSSPRR